jgi:nicotinamide-nucleotide amidase
MTYLPEITRLAVNLGNVLLRGNLRCSVAESCTGGSLAAAITGVSGSSKWFECGYVTYSNASKLQLPGVSSAVIDSYGAVSDPVVRAMAKGTLVASKANLSVAISGIAGPLGGTSEKPVGTVWLAWANDAGLVDSECFLFAGDRNAVREQAVIKALEKLIQLAKENCTKTGN